MAIKIAGITDSFTDGLEFSPSLTIFFQGCTLHCKGCQNPELQSLDGGYEIGEDEIIQHIEKYYDFYNGVVFSGGDPLDQPDNLISLASKISKPKVLYTGRIYEDISSNIRELFDIIVDGPYREDLKTNGFPASSNQRIIRK